MGKYFFWVQMFLLLLMFYFSHLSLIFENIFLLVPFVAAIITGLWASYDLGPETYSPFPEPRKNGKIAQFGPYKYSRHPMYTALFIITLILFITNASFQSFIIIAVFVYVTDEKASLEENLLAKKHTVYSSYAAKTKKFVPFIY